LFDVVTIFALLEAAFIIAFAFSWHYNKSNSGNNSKGVYIRILILGYVFCFGGVITGVCECSVQSIRAVLRGCRALQPVAAGVVLGGILAVVVVMVFCNEC
jgi:hypothetical protein